MNSLTLILVPDPLRTSVTSSERVGFAARVALPMGAYSQGSTETAERQFFLFNNKNETFIRVNIIKEEGTLIKS